VSKDITLKFRETFQKSLINVLDEYSLIDENTSLINPLYLDYSDLKIISERNANIIICPRDLNHFTNRYFPIDDYIGHGIKFSIGTGWLGEDLFKEVRLFRNKYKELNLSSVQLLHSITNVPYSLYFSKNSENSECTIDINRSADMVFIDIADTRFQFFPEDMELQSICDFIVDDLGSSNISDVMKSGKFTVRNNRLVNSDENRIIINVNTTRERLYKTGRYDDLKRKKETIRNTQMLDMSGRSDDEIKMFSDAPEDNILIDSDEDFRIKTKIPSFKPKTKPGQRSLFEEFEHLISSSQSDDFQETPELNLLAMESEPLKHLEEEILQVKSVDEKIISSLSPVKKIDKSKNVNSESKVELPKNVKLKFGDD
jgi:hypothetical protein